MNVLIFVSFNWKKRNGDTAGSNLQTGRQRPPHGAHRLQLERKGGREEGRHAGKGEERNCQCVAATTRESDFLLPETGVKGTGKRGGE